MNNDLKIFSNNEFGQIRVIEKENGVWFIGRDVAEVLGYQDASSAVSKKVDEDDRIKEMIAHCQNGNMVKTQTTLINESGLYSLVLSSKLPGAKKFKKWVTSEVLPSIRKHGAYMTENTLEKAITDPDFLIQLATNLKEERQKRLEAEKQVELVKPAVEFTLRVANSLNSILVRELAKTLSTSSFKIGEKKLYEKLRKWNLIMKNSTEPVQAAIERGIFEVVEGTRETSKGVFTYRTTRVTGKGQLYIAEKLRKEA